ncbi:hypothetical protein ACFLXF_00175 [Chloroflexota bacterium]
MDILLYIGSAIIFIWGIAHIIPTKSVVKGFGEISDDNTKIITMEWAAEGMTLCFIGLLVLLVTIIEGSQNTVSTLVYRISAGMLVVMAIWTLVTGARTSVVPIKICPIVKTAVAILFIIGSLL